MMIQETAKKHFKDRFGARRVLVRGSYMTTDIVVLLDLTRKKIKMRVKRVTETQKTEHMGDHRDLSIV